MKTEHDMDPEQTRHKDIAGGALTNDGGEDRVKESFKLYLRDISRHPLLAAEEERRLARTYRDERQNPKIRAQARQHLICSNLRFVVLIARTHRKNLPLEEKVSAGNLGLIRAVEKFDPQKGRFTTYATAWIKQSIDRECIENRIEGRALRKPAYAQWMERKIRRINDEYYKEHGVPPSEEYILQKLGRKSYCNMSACLERLRRLAPARSIDALIDFRSGNDDFCEWEGSSPAEAAARDDLKEHIRTLISCLPARKWVVVENHLLNGLTFEYIGRKLLGLTRERARQMEIEALKYLRRISKIATPGLTDYANERQE